MIFCLITIPISGFSISWISENMTNEQSHWIIHTKLDPPTQSIKRVERRELEVNIAKYNQYQLCIVHAYAGYGKTTFLKDWFESHLNNSKTSVWISLDEEDKNISSLFTYLVEGLRKINISCDSLQQLAEQNYQNIPIRVLSSALISVFCQQKREITIFLDDYHRASSESTDEFFETLFAYTPGNIKFVLSSRAYPTFNVEHYRANGKLVDIHSNTLRFNEKELVCLFENHLSSSDAKLVWQRTEGWPIACQMTYYLLINNTLNCHDILSFTGTHSELSNYITEQIFQSLTENEQLFLMITSVVERFTAELADCLHDDYEAWALMEQLEQKKLFLVPLKGKDGWFRYHQLFREYLNNKLQSKIKDISSIHRKAANWLFENNYVAEAINQALSGDNSELAAHLLNLAGGWRLTFKGRLDFLQRTLKQLPNEIIYSYPRLYLNKIIILIRSGKILVARDIASKFKIKSNNFSVWNEQPISELIRMEWIVITDLLMGSYADISATDERLTTLIELNQLDNVIQPEDSILRGIIDGCLYHQYWERGDIERADEVQKRRTATMMQEKPRSVYWLVYNHINQSILEVEKCKLSNAADALAEGLNLVEKYPELDFNLNSAISVFLAELAYLKNDLEHAKALLKPALLHLEQYDASFKHYAPAFVTMIAIQRITSDKKSVQEVITSGYHIANTRKLPRLKTLCDIQLVKYILLAGEVDEARAKWEKLELSEIADNFPNHRDLSVYLPELASLIFARLFIYESNYEKAEIILNLIQNKIKTQKRYRILVELYLLRARISFGYKDTKNTILYINMAVDISLHEDYQRVFIDEGQTSLEMFKLALDDHLLLGSVNHYYVKFITEVTKSINIESRTISSISEGAGLTDLEYKIVVEVSNGLSNKHIARIFDVNEDFIKYQLRKIFKKWNISSRHEASKILAGYMREY